MATFSHLLQIDPRTTGGFVYDFGTITAVSDTLSKSISTVPIVTLPTDSTFALQSGTSQTYSFQFSRRCPGVEQDPMDTTTWNNAHWIRGVTSLVNRWQARTDGYSLYFNRDGANLNYPALDDVNVYVRSISVQAQGGFTDTITGTIQVVIGGRMGGSD